MDTNQLILEELRRIRIALEATMPDRWQRVPAAARLLGIPVGTLRRLVDDNKVPIMVPKKTRARKSFLVDVVATRDLLQKESFHLK